MNIKFNSILLEKAVLFETLEAATINLIELYPGIEVSIQVDDDTNDVIINLGPILEYIIPKGFDNKIGRIYWNKKVKKSKQK